MVDICRYSTERDIAEKVFLLAFVYPGKYNIYQMDDLIFDKKCNRSYRAIKNTGYIHEDIIYREPANRKGRKEKLLTSTFIPIMDEIRYRLDIEYSRYPDAPERGYPDEFDWNILEDKFNSRFLKYYLEKGLLKKIRDPTPGFDAIEYLLGCFDRLLILWDQNPGLKKLSESLETNEFSTVEECIKQYDAESKRLKLKINSLRKKHEWPISKWMFDVPYDFFEECILFYSFPLETINKFKWLSEYGRMYYMVKPLLQKFNSEIDVDFLLK